MGRPASAISCNGAFACTAVGGAGAKVECLGDLRTVAYDSRTDTGPAVHCSCGEEGEGGAFKRV